MPTTSTTLSIVLSMYMFLTVDFRVCVGPDDASLVDGEMTPSSPEMSAEVGSSVSIGVRQRDTEQKIR